MSVIGTIQAFNEADRIGGAVESLLAAGCDRVVVLDGAWAALDGSLFAGVGSHLSTDGTGDAARAAGAEFVERPEAIGGGDGWKRDLLIRVSGAEPGDHLLLIDADERLEGTIDVSEAPSWHGCVVLRNDKPNDLEQIRTPWLDRSVRASVPMLRWLRYSTHLRCESPGRYVDASGPVEVYLIESLAAHADTTLELAALAALRSVEMSLPNDRMTVLPIVPGIEISHCVEASPARVAAKRAYYEASTV